MSLTRRVVAGSTAQKLQSTSTTSHGSEQPGAHPNTSLPPLHRGLLRPRPRPPLPSRGQLRKSARRRRIGGLDLDDDLEPEGEDEGGSQVVRMERLSGGADQGQQHDGDEQSRRDETANGVRALLDERHAETRLALPPKTARRASSGVFANQRYARACCDAVAQAGVRADAGVTIRRALLEYLRAQRASPTPDRGGLARVKEQLAMYFPRVADPTTRGLALNPADGVSKAQAFSAAAASHCLLVLVLLVPQLRRTPAGTGVALATHAAQARLRPGGEIVT